MRRFGRETATRDGAGSRDANLFSYKIRWICSGSLSKPAVGFEILGIKAYLLGVCLTPIYH